MGFELTWQLLNESLDNLRCIDIPSEKCSVSESRSNLPRTALNQSLKLWVNSSPGGTFPHNLIN